MLISNKTIDVSDVSLLAVNLSVVAYAAINNLDMAWFFWVYLAQSLTIGFFTFFKILSLKNPIAKDVLINGQPVTNAKVAQYFMAGFFVFHFGIFHLVYFFFMIFFLGVGQLFRWDILFAIMMFFINHLISFLINNPIDSQRPQNLGSIFFKPYIRIVPIHLIIVFGGLTLGSGGAIVLMLAKTVIDFGMHLLEHRAQNRAAVTTSNSILNT